MRIMIVMVGVIIMRGLVLLRLVSRRMGSVNARGWSERLGRR